jgi:hypothetical protein
MVKIEMALEKVEEKGQQVLRSSEYIWMLGQHWPINALDDHRIIRVEAFGAELQEIAARLPGLPPGQQLNDERSGITTCRTWFQIDARELSNRMRQVYP